MNMRGTIFLPDGTNVDRLVENVQVKSRFEDGYIDAIGAIKLNGKRTRVQSGYRNDVLVWKVCSESEVCRA